MLNVKNLSLWIPQVSGFVRAVDRVSFSIEKGKTLAIIGESGCGKSMTALSILRLAPAHAVYLKDSEIILDELPLLHLSEKNMRKVRSQKISMIFQDPMTSLNPVLNIYEQLKEAILQVEPTLDTFALKQRACDLLQQVKIPDPDHRLHAYPHELSGGMRQRVMIAIALAKRPQLLIADEPTTALDVTTQAQILRLIKELQKTYHMSMLLITHDLGIAAQIADDIAVMYAGHFVEKASSAAFFQQPMHPFSQLINRSLPDLDKKDRELDIIPGFVPPLDQVFQGCRFYHRCPLAQQICQLEEPTWQSISDHEVRCHFQEDVKEPDRKQKIQEQKISNKIILSIKDLKVYFPIKKGILKKVKGYVKSVDGVSFDIVSGKTVALVGESGCGKTTIAKAILGLHTAISGNMYYENDSIEENIKRKKRQLRKELQMVFQDPFSSMNPRMRVMDIIAEGMTNQKIQLNPIARDKRIDTLLEQVGLSASYKWRFPHEFSGGQRQRICIARALAVEPKVIICDEPTSALDVSVQAQVLNLFKALQKELGLTYLFISHNISVVGYMADEIAVMYLGRIVEYGTTKQVLRTPKHPYTQALLDSVPKEKKPLPDINQLLSEETPSPIKRPKGCFFHTRCQYAKETCRLIYPKQTNVGEDHLVSCHLYGEISK